VHWDGSAWTQVGGFEADTFLYDVDADRADDVWAVGHGVIEHWDGTTWTTLPQQPVNVYSVAVVSPDDVWMAGDDGAHPPDRPQAAMLHWDGTHSRVRPTPVSPYPQRTARRERGELRRRLCRGIGP
jgi:hypothetical protein